MSAPEQEAVEQIRKKKTVWLMAGGAASLLFPLLGAFYLHWSAGAGAQGPSGRSDVFERRDGGEKHITPSQTAVPSVGQMAPAPTSLATGAKETPVGSSLDFIKSNDEMKNKVAVEPPKPATATAAAPAAPAAAPAAPAAPAPAKTAAKKEKKEFSMPKLQPSRGFTNFGKGSSAPAGAKGGSAPQGANAQDLMKSLPPGAENDPRVQQYLKQQGK
jgi:hypothetical protein